MDAAGPCTRLLALDPAAAAGWSHGCCTDLPWPNITVIALTLASKHDRQVLFRDDSQQLRLVVTTKNLSHSTARGVSSLLSCTLAYEQPEQLGHSSNRSNWATLAHDKPAADLYLCQSPLMQEALDDSPEPPEHPRCVDHEHATKVLRVVVLQETTPHHQCRVSRLASVADQQQ